MWIETENTALQRLKTPEIDDAVEFSDNNTAQVPQDVGETLIETYDTIHERNSE